jgi:hypothetical protein
METGGGGAPFMKTFATGVPAVAFSVVFVLLGTAPASATTFTYAFCSATTNPGGEAASCLPGLGAALRITDELPGLDPADPNDFYVLLATDTRLSGGFDTTTYTGINGVQFDTPYKTDQYEGVPTLDHSLVDGAGDWIAFFGQINVCPSGNAQDKSVCSVVANSGATDTGDIDIWAFKINLIDSLVNPFTATTALTMRVSFLPTHNMGSNVVLPIGTPTPFEDPPDVTAVPEPTSLVLLGTGLVWGAGRIRGRRKTQ